MAVIRGTNAAQSLDGTGQDDLIFAYGGNDQAFGLNGDDLIFGGTGDDSIFGNNDNDDLDGDLGRDDVFGGAGDDTLFGGLRADADFLYGGDGRDTLYGGEGFDFLNGGAGADLILGIGSEGGWASAVGYTFGLRGVNVNLETGQAIDEFGDTDRLVGIRDVDGTDLNDRITGNDEDNFFTPYDGRDTVTGGAGRDEVNYNTGGTQGIVANLVTGRVTDNFGDIDTLRQIEVIRGTEGFSDRIIGGDEDNVFLGLGGDDILDGGNGFDEVWFNRDIDLGGTRGVTADLSGGFADDGFGDLDSLIRIEGLRGSVLADRLTGDGLANRLDGDFGGDTLFGGSGNDTLAGSQGADRLFGGAGIDWASWAGDRAAGGTRGVTVNLAGGTATDGFGTLDTLATIENVELTAGRDTVTGDSAANTILAGDGADSVDAGAGADVIEGGAGNDVLAGRGARDRFVFVEGWGTDRITDFRADLSETLDFTGHAFVDARTDLRITQSGADVLVRSGADTIRLSGIDLAELTDANFLF